MQMELFGPPPAKASVFHEEERFGRWDAKCGLALRNAYSAQLYGDRFTAYERAFRDERASQALASRGQPPGSP